MKPTSVFYRETKTFGNYQNVTIEMSAETGVHSLDETLEMLKRKVQEKLQERAEAEEIERETQWQRDNTSRAIDDLHDKVEQARAQWERAKDFLAKHGIELNEELPF